MSRVLVIGIDSANLDLVEEYAAAGQLPHIARLLAAGGRALLRSTMPVMSAAAWTSMITGQNPGKHGIYDFIRFIPNSYRIQATRSDQTSFRTIFDLASQQGRWVLAVNIPLTYPPRPVNGAMIVGPIAPQRGPFAYPPELDRELRASGYRLDPDLAYAPGRDAEWLAEMKAVTRQQVEWTLTLMRREPWDLAMVVLRIVDEVMGFCWHHIDPTHPRHDPVQARQFGSCLLDAHRVIDEAVGRFLEAAGPDTVVMLVSDHGGGPVYKEVFLNVWLEQRGWLVRKRGNPLNTWRISMQRRVGLTREKISPLIDRPLISALRKHIPDSIQHAIVPVETFSLVDVVDWSRTRAYSLGNIGQIYLNLKGREPQGIVDQGAERERVLSALIDDLRQLSDDGQLVVDEIYRSDDIYHGPYAWRGPDLNIIMRGMTYITQSWREMAGTAVFGEVGNHWSGTHRPLGMVALAGSGIPAVGRRPEAQIVDVAPTLLWLLGLPIPDDIDGSVLASMLPAATLAERPPAQIEAAAAPLPKVAPQDWADAEEEQEVLDRLRDLGYLE